MPLAVKESNQFRRDVKKVKKQGKDLSKLKTIVSLLLNEKELPPKNRDHLLTGNWKNHRECHVEPDWLLI